MLRAGRIWKSERVIPGFFCLFSCAPGLPLGPGQPPFGPPDRHDPSPKRAAEIVEDILGAIVLMLGRLDRITCSARWISGW